MTSESLDSVVESISVSIDQPRLQRLQVLGEAFERWLGDGHRCTPEFMLQLLLLHLDDSLVFADYQHRECFRRLLGQAFDEAAGVIAQRIAEEIVVHVYEDEDQLQ